MLLKLDVILIDPNLQCLKLSIYWCKNDNILYLMTGFILSMTKAISTFMMMNNINQISISHFLIQKQRNHNV